MGIWLINILKAVVVWFLYLTVSVVVETESLIPLILETTTEHDPEPVPSPMSHFYNLLPQEPSFCYCLLSLILQKISHKISVHISCFFYPSCMHTPLCCPEFHCPDSPSVLSVLYKTRSSHRCYIQN